MNAKRQARLSAADRAEAALAAIDVWQPVTNGMITVTADSARREAAAVDEAAADGRWLGLLHGMPVAIKDNIETAGVRTTSASLFFKDHVPNHNAPVVARLKRAGAVIVGKATMHELAFGVRSHNPVTGASRNPYDPSRIPGGSSGGSGIAVATGMCEGALGTDTGGSVRLPAAINGITGLRPTAGRVSNRGCTPVSGPHDTIGPMARTAADCARIFAVIAGYDPEDPTSIDHGLENFLPTLADGISGVRIGVPSNHYLDDCSQAVATSFERALQTLESLGARLVTVRLEGAETIHEHASKMIYSDMLEVHADRIADESKWAPMTLERLKTALTISGRDYARAMRVKERWKRTLAHLFQDIDVLATPTMPDEPPPVEDGRTLLATTAAVTRNTYAGAFGGIPGISVPAGRSANGLPLGLQLEAAWWREPLLFRTAHAFQSSTDWHTMRPKRPA